MVAGALGGAFYMAVVHGDGQVVPFLLWNGAVGDAAPAGAARGKRRRLHDDPPQIAGRRRPHAKLVARNRAVLANLQATCSTRAFRTVPPQELTDAAHKAARLIDTDAHIQTASRSYTRALWYQSRVWDPDD